jgi:hypothetical protein
LLLLSLCSGAQVPLPGNQQSNLRQKFISTRADSLKIDSISILPISFLIENADTSAYRLDFVKAILYWKKKPVADSVLVTYRVFPFQLNAVKQRLNYDSVANLFYVKPYEFSSGQREGTTGIFNFGELKAEGSIGRQLGFGNRQDVVVNSSWNLQLSGMLSDSIEVQAAITDNNIPIQPDGTTQNLNEFDQVYLQFKKAGWQLNLGDIDIRQNKDYFLSFYKRLQGASFQTNNRISPTVNSSTLVSGSIAKGKFTRNVFQGLEGNQGPYRLTGANNEFFFIVLANTERVFIDGQLMQRGEDQDYVINYNTAEVTFTPKRMITKDSRIQIEFEYADRNYVNTNLYLSQEFEINKKLKIRTGFFNNSDSKRSGIQQELTEDQRRFLTTIGDNIEQALYPSAITEPFEAGKILYEKIIVTPGVDSFYRYSVNAVTAIYSLSFVNLGEGKGNYIPDFNGANGKVYKYVPPVGTTKQGSYEPAQLLVTPKKQQLLNLGIDYVISKTTTLKTEVATSNYDRNTFSGIGNGDNRGWAAKFQLNNSNILRKTSKNQLTTALDYEYVQRKFKPLERLRTVEFSRDWGLPLTPVLVDESIIKASAGLRNNNGNSLSYQFINYHRSDEYNGIQNSLVQVINLAGWQMNNQVVHTHFNNLNEKGSFLRPVIDLSKLFKRVNNWRLGFRYSLEHNSVRNKLSDTLTPFAFSFDSYSMYLKSDETKKNRFGITFFTRTDKYPVKKNFVKGDRSLNLNLQTELLGNPRRQFYLNATFRKLKVYNPAVSGQKEDETILGRAEYNMSEWKGLLTGNLLYENGAGQEQRRDFAYLEVPAGTGVYAWIDYNNDGIQQLNEFELAAFPDQAKFIRVFTPTNEFIKANYITFSYRFDISPRMLLGNKKLKGFQQLISKINLTTSLQTTKKSLSSGSFEFNPFKYGINNTSLITAFTDILNNFAFNRFGSKWGFDLSNHRRNGKSLLTYGYESNKLNDWLLKARWNISRAVSLSLNGRKGLTALYTPQFANRNYQLTIYSAEPLLTYIKGTSFRLVAGYRFDDRKNLPLYGGEKSSSHSVSLESRYNILQNSSLTGKFTFNSIQYKGAANTTVGYIMMDGLLPGNNYLWSLGFTKRLLNNLELNLTYDGRNSGKSKTVHLGRAGVTALF